VSAHLAYVRADTQPRSQGPLADVVRLRHVLERHAARTDPGWALQAVADQLAYDAALIRLARKRGIATGPGDFDIPERHGLSQTIDKCRKFDQDPGSVYWLDRSRDGFGNPHVELVISPLTIDKLMVQAVYEPYGTVLMTSATLAVKGEFGFWSNRVGLPLVDPERRLSGVFPSPFDYANRVLTGCPVDFPSPDQPSYQDRLES